MKIAELGGSSPVNLEQEVVRQPWVRPELTVINASDAQSGANPIQPEGAFGTGS